MEYSQYPQTTLPWTSWVLGTASTCCTELRLACRNGPLFPGRGCLQAAYFVPPTVFVDVLTDRDAPVWREEIFGARERTSALGVPLSRHTYHRRAPQGTPVAMPGDHAAWNIRCRSRAGPVL
jgi:hypothetical protein